MIEINEKMPNRLHTSLLLASRRNEPANSKDLAIPAIWSPENCRKLEATKQKKTIQQWQKNSSTPHSFQLNTEIDLPHSSATKVSDYTERGK